MEIVLLKMEIVSSVIPPTKLVNDAISDIRDCGTYGRQLADYLVRHDFSAIANVPYGFTYNERDGINSGVFDKAKKTYPSDFFDLGINGMPPDIIWSAILISIASNFSGILYCIDGDIYEGEIYQYLDLPNVVPFEGDTLSEVCIPYCEISSLGSVVNFIRKVDSLRSVYVACQREEIFSPSILLKNILDRDGVIAFILAAEQN